MKEARHCKCYNEAGKHGESNSCDIEPPVVWMGMQAIL
jgi:hypothetical protein